jgi:hypothetical protein
MIRLSIYHFICIDYLRGSHWDNDFHLFYTTLGKIIKLTPDGIIERPDG